MIHQNSDGDKFKKILILDFQLRDAEWTLWINVRIVPRAWHFLRQHRLSFNSIISSTKFIYYKGKVLITAWIHTFNSNCKPAFCLIVFITAYNQTKVHRELLMSRNWNDRNVFLLNGNIFECIWVSRKISSEIAQHPMTEVCYQKRRRKNVKSMSQHWISILWTRCTSLLALNPVVHAVAFPGWKFKSGFEIYSFITGLITLISLH